MKGTILWIAYIFAAFIYDEGYPTIAYLLIGFATWEAAYEAYWLPRKKKKSASKDVVE